MPDLLPYNSPKARGYRGAATKKAKKAKAKKPKPAPPQDLVCVPGEYLAELERRPKKCPTATRTAKRKKPEDCGCAPTSGAGRVDPVPTAKKRKRKSKPKAPSPAPRGRRKAVIVPGHPAARDTCLSCGGPHTVSQHYSHKYGQGKGRWPK